MDNLARQMFTKAAGIHRVFRWMGNGRKQRISEVPTKKYQLVLGLTGVKKTMDVFLMFTVFFLKGA